MLFPFADYWWFYAGFTMFVLLMLALDLGVFHKKAHEVSVKEAAGWTIVWSSLALLFNGGFFLYVKNLHGTEVAKQLGLEFLTGFVVEKSLALDNIFVFAVVFSYFCIPKIYQHRILFYGIIGALIFRAIFVALGSILMAYHWLMVFFGVLLIVTGVKMLFAPSEMMDPESNWILRFLKKLLPIHSKVEGDAFFIRKGGVVFATPLFVALIFLEFSDILFAVDSVPAIFALTKEPLIVFTSNIFAILGLRSLYFLMAGVMDRFHLIKYGLASVLVFVGLKLSWLNEVFDGKFPIGWSLGIIGGLMGSSVVLSFLIPARKAVIPKDCPVPGIRPT